MTKGPSNLQLLLIIYIEYSEAIYFTILFGVVWKYQIAQYYFLEIFKMDFLTFYFLTFYLKCKE